MVKLIVVISMEFQKINTDIKVLTLRELVVIIDMVMNTVCG